MAPLSPGRPAQLRLIELREKARQALGERFSLKDFHNAVLTAGTLPIDMLEREVDTYIQPRAADESHTRAVYSETTAILGGHMRLTSAIRLVMHGAILRIEPAAPQPTTSAKR